MRTFNFKNSAYSLWRVWRTRKLPAKQNKFTATIFQTWYWIIKLRWISIVWDTHRTWVSNGLYFSLTFGLEIINSSPDSRVLILRAAWWFWKGSVVHTPSPEEMSSSMGGLLFPRDTHRAWRRKGTPSQPYQPNNPDSQWGDRGHRQIALTSWSTTFITWQWN